MNNDIFFNINDTLSHNCLFNFLIGERGVGKSFQAKKFVFNHFLKTGKKFIYLRRYKDELKKALYADKEPIFFKQLTKDIIKKNSWTVKNNTIYINDKICGYGIPLSTSNILKSATYEDVDTIIFDEFIIDKGNYHYLQNEVIKFLEFYETVARLRDVRVIFLGNAITLSNPYFTYFDISLPYNTTFKKFNNDILLCYIKNEKYREVKEKTRFGKLIKDTDYGLYAMNNQFLNDSKTFIKKRTNESVLKFIIIVNKNFFGVWFDYKLNQIYISKSYDNNCKLKYACDEKSHDINYFKMNTTNISFKILKNTYNNGNLFFENQKIKNLCSGLIQKF